MLKTVTYSIAGICLLSFLGSVPSWAEDAKNYISKDQTKAICEGDATVLGRPYISSVLTTHGIDALTFAEMVNDPAVMGSALAAFAIEPASYAALIKEKKAVEYALAMDILVAARAQMIVGARLNFNKTQLALIASLEEARNRVVGGFYETLGDFDAINDIKLKTNAFSAFDPAPYNSLTDIPSPLRRYLEALGSDKSPEIFANTNQIPTPFWAAVGGSLYLDVSGLNGADLGADVRDQSASGGSFVFECSKKSGTKVAELFRVFDAEKDMTRAEKSTKWEKPGFVIRGKIDDLSIGTDDKTFKGLDPSQINYTLDRTAETEEKEPGKSRKVTANAYLGLGKTFGKNPKDSLSGHSIYAFVGLSRNTTDLAALKQSFKDLPVPVEGDDDFFTKEIDAISYGLTYSHYLRSLPIFQGYAGFSLYRTHDAEQNARFIRGRAFYDRLIVSGVPADICINGRPINFAGLRLSCRLDSFLEYAHVEKAGRSEDFKDLDDDDYMGLGGRVSATLSFPNSVFENLSLATSYRYMWVFRGDAKNPDLLKVTASFAPNGSERFSLNLGYQKGENSETFQPIDQIEAGFGIKF